MKSLIFTKQNSTLEYLKEGDILDAIDYLEGSIITGTLFLNDNNMENFNSEIDPEFYYTDEQGELVLTESEINDGIASLNIDVNTVYTTKVDSLDEEEILAVVSADSWNMNRILELNGFSQEEIVISKHFGDLEKVATGEYYRYIESQIVIADEEPEGEESFEFKGKFYYKY